MKKTYIIAEIGINHNGDMDIIKKLIDIAAVAGCDSVKFQKRNPDICVPEHQKSVMRDTPWGRMSYIDYKHKIELTDEDYYTIDVYCMHKGIDWSVSVWDIDSVNSHVITRSENTLPYIKIPSALLTNDELLLASKRKSNSLFGKPKIILSTGMSTLEEIDHAVSVLETGGETDFSTKEAFKNYALLHSNSAYPAPNEDLNLKCIQTLKDRYDCEVGYSGHEFGLTTTIASVAMGATIIERHITLDRTMWGTDQMCSVEPQGLIKLVRGIRELEEALGDGIKRVTEKEQIIKDKLRK
jgi:N-acetylneuraminate synthase